MTPFIYNYYNTLNDSVKDRCFFTFLAFHIEKPTKSVKINMF